MLAGSVRATLVVTFAITVAWALAETWVALSGGVLVTDNVTGPGRNFSETTPEERNCPRCCRPRRFGSRAIAPLAGRPVGSLDHDRQGANGCKFGSDFGCSLGFRKPSGCADVDRAEGDRLAFRES